MFNDLNAKKIAERIKYLREIFDTSFEKLSEVTSLSIEDYKLLEEGKLDFTFSFLQKLSKFYSVDIVELMSGSAPKLNGFEVVRSGEGIPLERREGFKYLHMAPLFKNKTAEPFMVYAPFSKKDKDKPIPLSQHNDEELNLVIEGKLKVRINDYETVLEKGDSVYYNANLLHGMVAMEKGTKFLSVVIKGDKKEEIEKPKIIKNDKLTFKEERVYNKFITPKTNENGKLLSLDFHPPKNFNFSYDVVDALAKTSPNKPCLLWVSRDKEERIFTFSDISRLSNKCANFLLKNNIKKGDKVMLVLKRHYQFWPAIIALHKIGAIVVPATHLLTKKDFEYRFNAAGINAIIITTDGQAIDECQEAISNCPSVRTIISVGEKREGFLDFDSLIENESDVLERIENDIDDTMIMYFTSGTTGYPKITMHTYGYPLGHFVTAKYWHNVSSDGVHLTISDTGWAKSVWGKLYGQWLSETCVFTYDFDKFSAPDILEMFSKYNITTFCAPPTMYRFFIKEDLSKYDLSSLKHATIAGEALNPEVYEQFYKATGLKLMEGFGQTEMTLCVANLVGDEPKPGSMGKPSPQYDVDLVDSFGKSVKDGEVGEIVIRTDKFTPFGMFKGYYNDKETTNRVWNNGVYHTGDVAWRDEDGYIWYVGRTDDVIKSSGYRIGPFEVESVLMELPYVLECAVIGVPDETRGQLVKAVIVLTKGTVPSDEIKKDIQMYFKEHTAPYKYPRIIEFRESLPKTISGKIIRKDLR